MAGQKLLFLKDILASVSPSPQEIKKEKDAAASLIARFSSAAPKGSKLQLMGSVAKGTFIRGSNDVDVFLLLPKSVPRESFERLVRACAKKAFPKAKSEVAFAEHPYVRLWVEGRKIDLVPAYNISHIDQMASSVDRSILHLRFILHNLPASKKGDVLLLKKFLKANGLYGAEIRVEGFSGYLCELLIIKYGGFLSALKAISKWKLPVRLHLGNGKGKEFPEAPLTFIDPVDPDRNVAAIVSKENLLRLMSLAKHFLVKPSSVYFSGDDENFRKKQLDRFLKSKGPKRLLAFKRPKLVDDILWGQLKRLSRAIIVSAEAFEFEVSDTYLFADKKECRLYFSFSTETLSSFASVRGPPVKMNEHCVRFRKSHPNASFSTKNGHIYAKIKRGVRAIDAALIQILKKRHGFPSHIPSAMSLSTLE